MLASVATGSRESGGLHLLGRAVTKTHRLVRTGLDPLPVLAQTPKRSSCWQATPLRRLGKSPPGPQQPSAVATSAPIPASVTPCSFRCAVPKFPPSWDTSQRDSRAQPKPVRLPAIAAKPAKAPGPNQATGRGMGESLGLQHIFGGHKTTSQPQWGPRGSSGWGGIERTHRPGWCPPATHRHRAPERLQLETDVCLEATAPTCSLSC